VVTFDGCHPLIFVGNQWRWDQVKTAVRFGTRLLESVGSSNPALSVICYKSLRKASVVASRWVVVRDYKFLDSGAIFQVTEETR